MYAVHVQRLVAAVGRHALAEVNANEGIQPVDGGTRALRKLAGDFRVEVAFAAQTREVRVEQIDTVLDASFLLDDGLSAHDGAAGHSSRTADASHLLEYQHVRTQLAGTHSSAQAGHAGADDDDVRLLKRNLHSRFFSGFARKRSGNRSLDGFAGDGRAGNGGDISALRFHDRCRDLFDRRIADTRGLAVSADLNRHDLAALDGNGHIHIAANTLADAIEDAVSSLRHGRNGTQQQARTQQQAQELFHFPILLRLDNFQSFTPSDKIISF